MSGKGRAGGAALVGVRAGQPALGWRRAAAVSVVGLVVAAGGAGAAQAASPTWKLVGTSRYAGASWQRSLPNGVTQTGTLRVVVTGGVVEAGGLIQTCSASSCWGANLSAHQLTAVINPGGTTARITGTLDAASFRDTTPGTTKVVRVDITVRTRGAADTWSVVSFEPDQAGRMLTKRYVNASRDGSSSGSLGQLGVIPRDGAGYVGTEKVYVRN